MIIKTLLACLILFAFVILYWVGEKILMFYRSNAPTPGFFFFIKHRLEVPEQLTAWIQKENPKREWCKLFFIDKPATIALSPETAQFVLANRETVLRSFIFADTGAYSVRPLFANNIVSADGADWRRFKTMYNPAFGSSAYQQYFPVFRDVTNKLVTKIEAMIKTNPKDEIDIVPLMSSFTIDVLGMTIMEIEFGSLDGKLSEYYDAYRSILKLAAQPQFLFFPWSENISWFGKGKKLKQQIHKMVELFRNVVEQTKAERGKHGILTHLIQASEGEEITDQELISNLFILFIGGHESTGSALSYACLELASNQHVQEKLYQEIVKTVGKDGEPSYEQISQIPYLEWTIAESLRLHPPFSQLATRKTMTDLTYENTFIPKGSLIGIDFYSLHRHPDHWSDPESFIPERFSPENKKKMHKFAYLPFSSGPSTLTIQLIDYYKNELLMNCNYCILLNIWKLCE